MFYQKFLKRLFDIVASLIILIVGFPVMLIVALLVFKNLGRPVLYKQERPGLHEYTFQLYKFRSMKEKADCGEFLLTDEERLDEFGKLLRKSSLDELPELVNILKGDMSFVGPRPLLTEYLSIYNEYHKRRHEVRPGLTGLAQVMGRNSVPWEERFDYDVEYVENVGFLLDAKILLKTIILVLKRKGIAEEGRETMSKFDGYEN